MTLRLRGAFLPVSIAILVGAALMVPLPVYVETPREAVSLDERVVVEVKGASLDGDYLLLAVTLRQGTVARVVQSWFDGDRSVILQEQVVPAHEDEETYFSRQRDLFDETASVAAAVGLAAAGYPVAADALTGSGVVVVEVVPGTPAEGRLEPGDVIVAVNGAPVSGFDDLRDAIPQVTGSIVSMDVVRDDDARQVGLETAELQTVEGPRAGVGIVGQTHEPRIDLPVPVAVDSGQIGGPSAGLMIALTVYDKADTDADLAAGRRIAGTGTITQDGTVGSVGGVRQKVAAAEASGADTLLVPAHLAAIAESARRPGSTLEILGVATFDEALEMLRTGATVTGWAVPLAA